MSKTWLTKIFFVAVLVFVLAAILTTPLGTVLLLGLSGWLVFQIYEFLNKRNYEKSAAFVVLFLSVTITVLVVFVVSWTVGCVFGMNGCRSPF
jgi:predicted PurR-regulated permease PerM